MRPPLVHTALANGATPPTGCEEFLVLDYRPGVPSARRLNINLPSFVHSVCHLPDRVLDLLELACYVFAMDRSFSRGRIDAVEYHSWSRCLQLIIRVRDYNFWNTAECSSILSDTLQFVTGDRDFSVVFQPGHSTPSTGLFDKTEFQVDGSRKEVEIALFSGGADSLAGAIDLLENTNGEVILASHQASNAARKTQRALIMALSELYPDRVRHYPFHCNFQGQRAPDETQRSRSFLFASIAYALAYAYGQRSFHVFENGITSINLHRREDLLNARASRTTHPKTIAGLSALFSLISNNPFQVMHPYLQLTKADVLKRVVEKQANLLASSVSCTRTSFAKGDATHCGTCFQCIDRRLAAFAAGVEEFDHRGLYAFDIVSEPLDAETKTIALDYIRQAIDLDQSSSDDFYEKYLFDISQIIDDLPFGGDELDRTQTLWELYQRHAATVRSALTAIRVLHDDVFSSSPARGSLLDLLSTREYLKPARERFVDALEPVLIQGIGEMFATHRPENENDLNEKLGALLRSHDSRFRSEYPTVSYAGARVIPDHEMIDHDVLVEAKYIRNRTSPSVATEGIAADLTKYSQEAYIIFLIYDPDHRIKSDKVFRDDIHASGRNRVLIVR